MTVIKAILGVGGTILAGGGMVGGLIGVATGFGEGFGDALKQGSRRIRPSFHSEINSLENTVEFAKDVSAMVWKPALYGSIGAAMGVTFPISLPIAHTLYEDYKKRKADECHDTEIKILNYQKMKYNINKKDGKNNV